MDNPISIHMEQCGTVGVKMIVTSLLLESTVIDLVVRILRSSSVSLYSGSLIVRMKPVEKKDEDLYYIEK